MICWPYIRVTNRAKQGKYYKKVNFPQNLLQLEVKLVLGGVRLNYG